MRKKLDWSREEINSAADEKNVGHSKYRASLAKNKKEKQY